MKTELFLVLANTKSISTRFALDRPEVLDEYGKLIHLLFSSHNHPHVKACNDESH